ncbi:MAG: hypothetical protein ACYCQI_00875 [Gammaproteobacteria bacterium]
MAHARRLSSSQKIIMDLKLHEPANEILELDQLAVKSFGCYRATMENDSFGLCNPNPIPYTAKIFKKDAGMVIPYKHTGYVGKSQFAWGLAWILFFISFLYYFGNEKPTKMSLIFGTLGVLFRLPLTLHFTIKQAIKAELNHNSFHKRLTANGENEFKTVAEEYLYLRASLFARDEKPADSLHEQISTQYNHELLRLLVDCYRFLDANNPDILEITNMLDLDFIYFFRTWKAPTNVDNPDYEKNLIENLQEEYKTLRKDKKQHLRL